jgi:protein-L-isoaspartate(D-aspartate) O-methyltransferase
LLRQLADGGRLAGIVGRAPASKAVLYLAGAGQASALPIFDAAAPALPGFAEPPQFVF